MHGPGRAVVGSFTAPLGDATLLLASDGLLEYTTAERIVACIAGVVTAHHRAVDEVWWPQP